MKTFKTHGAAREYLRNEGWALTRLEYPSKDQRSTPIWWKFERNGETRYVVRIDRGAEIRDTL